MSPRAACTFLDVSHVFNFDLPQDATWIMCTASVARRGPVRKRRHQALPVRNSGGVVARDSRAYNRPQRFPRAAIFFLREAHGHRPVAGNRTWTRACRPAPFGSSGGGRWRWTSPRTWRPARTLRPRARARAPTDIRGLITAIHYCPSRGCPRSRVGDHHADAHPRDARLPRSLRARSMDSFVSTEQGEVVSFKYANRGVGQWHRRISLAVRTGVTTIRRVDEYRVCKYCPWSISWSPVQ